MSFNIEIKEFTHTIDDYGSTFLKLEFSGNDVEYSLINALRKVCLNQIPIYAFHPSKINILRNSSVFDNSYMRERLSQLPIFNLKHNINYLAS